MATTPEGKVKNKIKAVMTPHRPQLYWYMPVPGGYGAPSRDFIGFIHGRAFGIEAKAPGKKPTKRQILTMTQMRTAGAKVFLIHDDRSLQEFDDWLLLATLSAR